MPRNANKRRCSAAGCRAWAMRGKDVCGSHRRSPSPSEGEGRGEGEISARTHPDGRGEGENSHRRPPSPSEGEGRGEGAVPPLAADYTLDDLAAHAALALNRLQAWYAAHESDDSPRWVLAYVRQLYHCLARLADLWKQRATMGEGELNAALSGALADLGPDLPAEK